jgi:hypothetical protein
MSAAHQHEASAHRRSGHWRDPDMLLNPTRAASTAARWFLSFTRIMVVAVVLTGVHTLFAIEVAAVRGSE